MEQIHALTSSPYIWTLTTAIPSESKADPSGWHGRTPCTWTRRRLTCTGLQQAYQPTRFLARQPRRPLPYHHRRSGRLATHIRAVTSSLFIHTPALGEGIGSVMRGGVAGSRRNSLSSRANRPESTIIGEVVLHFERRQPGCEPEIRTSCIGNISVSRRHKCYSLVSWPWYSRVKLGRANIYTRRFSDEFLLENYGKSSLIWIFPI